MYIYEWLQVHVAYPFARALASFLGVKATALAQSKRAHLFPACSYKRHMCHRRYLSSGTQSTSTTQSANNAVQNKETPNTLKGLPLSFNFTPLNFFGLISKEFVPRFFAQNLCTFRNGTVLIDPPNAAALTLYFILISSAIF